MDRQTDGRTTYDGNTALALRASRGKNKTPNSCSYLCQKLTDFYVGVWIKRLKVRIALYGNPYPSQSYGASLAICDHTVLPATRHKWTRPAITPARQAGTRFIYRWEMEGWVDLGSVIVAWPGIKPRLLGHKSDALTIAPPSHPLLQGYSSWL